MKKFLCYDTNDATSGKINVDSRGMLKPNSTVPSGGTPYQQLVTDGNGNTKWEDRTHWVEKTYEELIPEQTLSSGISMGSLYMFPVSEFTILPNLEYTVVFDGVEYKCISTVLDGGVCIGNASIFAEMSESPVEDTGEPFLIAASDGVAVATATDGPHTISLNGLNIVYHALSLDYIPNGKFLNGFIEHRPATMTRDEASKYEEILSGALFPMLIWRYLKITELNVSTKNGVNIIRIKNNDGAVYTIEENSEGLYYFLDAKNGYNDLKIAVSSHQSKSYIHLEAGKPVTVNGNTQSSGNALDYTTFIVRKTGSLNGQDFEVLGNGTVKAYSVILPSSTEGSTKHFKITVDDSGTISATEVTS